MIKILYMTKSYTRYKAVRPQSRKMKDEKFNELMERYVDSTKQSEETDLKKMKEQIKTPVVSRRKVSAWVWATCAILLVAVISLSVVLPIVFNKEEKSETHYCDALNIHKIPVENMSDLKEEYQFDCMLPTIGMIDEPTLYLMSEREGSEIFGAFIEISVFDENFDGIDFHVLKKPYKMSSLKYYEYFSNEAVWNSLPVKYLITDDSGYYTYEITFSDDEYEYFVRFATYTSMEITQILDHIYLNR